MDLKGRRHHVSNGSEERPQSISQNAVRAVDVVQLLASSRVDVEILRTSGGGTGSESHFGYLV